MKAKIIKETIVILAGCATIVSLLIAIGIIPRLSSQPSSPSQTPTPALSSPPPTPTSTPTPTVPTNPKDILTWATREQPFIDDQLQSQNGNKWSEYTNNLGGCQFSSQTYHASASRADHFTPCLMLADQDSNLQNIAFQVQMTIIQGDAGGLIFHSTASGSNDYAFYICIDPLCTKGAYKLYMCQSMRYSRIISGPSPAIKTDFNQTHVLTVVALNGDIYLYINGEYITQVHDNTYISGYIGVMA